MKSSLKAAAKRIVQRCDQLSPYPLFYQWVMSDREKSVSDRWIRPSRHYLEFGMGGSTLRALQKSRTTVCTVESSADWIGKMRRYRAIRRAEGRRLKICHVDIGPTQKWGYPTSDAFPRAFECYSSEVFHFVMGDHLDVVFVDGRFRVACTLKTILACQKNREVRILIHDFWVRPGYQAVLDYLEPVDGADTLAVFSIKPQPDLLALEQAYEKFRHVAE